MKRLSLILFLFSLFNLFSPFPSEAARRALLVGINHYKNLPYYSKEQGKWITNLKGPLNDIRIMKQILISRYGFLEGDILLLKDHYATRDNILKKFKDWLIQGSREGDTVLFFFSGHGTQVNDQNGDEEDGLDEAFCPYDTVPEGARTVMEARLILDDELGLLLREFRGREVVGMVDSCHSGTMTRSIRGTPVSELEPTPAYQARFIPVKIEASYVRGGGFSLDLPRQEDVPEGQIFLSASRENQPSLEMTLPDGVHGAFTHGLVEGMEKLPGATYLKLYEYARKVVKDRYQLDQDPQIEPPPPGGNILARLAFASPPPPVAQAGQAGPRPPSPKPEPPAPPKPPVKPQPPPPPGKLQKPSPAPSPVKPSPPPLAAAPQPPPEVKGKRVLLRIEPLQGGTPGLMEELQKRLEGLPYLEVVEEGALFDRLIRGEVKEGKYRVRLLNRTGDRVRIPPAESVDALVRSIAPHLETAAIVKQLAHITHPAPPFKVSLSVEDERRDFRMGEKVVYRLSCEEDCYLLMLGLDSEGNFSMIFPNKYYNYDEKIKAGKKIQIPNEKMRRDGFELLFTPPAGEETVKVIATNVKLDLKSFNLGKFTENFNPKAFRGSALDPSSPSRELARDILSVLQEKAKKREFRWSEDTVVVRSHP